MRVAVLTDAIDDGSAGVGTYARGLASALAKTSTHEITFVHRRPHPFYAGKRELVYPGWGSKFVRKQVLMRHALASADFDLVHETFHFPPFLGRNPYRKVMTIHDMTPFVLPRRNMALPNWFWHRALTPMLARRSDHILTDSANSRADIIRILRLPPDRVSVAHLAADEVFHPQTSEEIERVRRRYEIPERFLLFVGTIEPRKNLRRAVAAFEGIASEHRDLAFVVAGGLGWRYGPILRAIEASPVSERIVLPGRVAAADLPALYAGAVALVYVPEYEGFGLPPLEAMQSGCPVVTSNNSSLPEVVGDAALTVDPLDVDAIGTAMGRIASDDALRQAFRESGLERARRFTWQQCADDTARAYDRTLAA